VVSLVANTRDYPARSVAVAIVVAAICAACGNAPGPDDGRRVARGAHAFVTEPGLVIATVYAGGGNANATHAHDFVVVVNRSHGTISASDTTLQYASGSGAVALGATDSTYAALPARTLDPGQAVMVRSLVLSVSGGRLALVRGIARLGCNGDSVACSPAKLARVVDLVGWGNAAWFEPLDGHGSAAPALSSDRALSRRADGCVDTDVNRADFELAAPTVRDANDAARPCPGGPTSTMTDSGVLPVPAPPAPTPPAPALPTPRESAAGPTLADLQGDAHRSPYVGRSFEGVTGIVTLVDDRRFAAETSEVDGVSAGAWVRTASRGPVGVGTLVELRGVVEEIRSECFRCDEESAAFANLSVTTLVASDVIVRASLAPPPPLSIGASGIPIPDSLGDHSSPVDLEALACLDESTAIDFFERLEGRRVSLASPRTAGPTRVTGDGRRELVVVADEADVVRNARGAPAAPLATELGSRVVLVDGAGPSLPMLDVGDQLAGPVVGVVDYERGRYVVRVTSWESARREALTREAASEIPNAQAGGFSLGSFNVHNLSATSASSHVLAVADTVVSSMRSPDVVALQEIQDDSGALDDHVTSAALTLARLVAAIAAASGPAYEPIDLAPVDGADGGEPGGNIRVALLVRTDRHITRVAGLEPVTTAGVEAAARIVQQGSRARLAQNPSRIGVYDEAFVAGRKPLVVELDGELGHLFVIVVHLRSRLGDAPRLGRFQPPARASERVRHAEAALVAEFAASIHAVEPSASIAVVGDFNDPPENSTLAPLAAAGLVDTLSAMPTDRRATYVYEGVGAALDGLWVSRDLWERLSMADVVHVHAERAFGASDHDPLRVVFGEPVATAPGPASSCAVRASASSGHAGVLLLAVLGWLAARNALGTPRASKRAAGGLERAQLRAHVLDRGSEADAEFGVRDPVQATRKEPGDRFVRFHRELRRAPAFLGRRDQRGRFERPRHPRVAAFEHDGDGLETVEAIEHSGDERHVADRGWPGVLLDHGEIGDRTRCASRACVVGARTTFDHRARRGTTPDDHDDLVVEPARERRFRGPERRGDVLHVLRVHRSGVWAATRSSGRARASRVSWQRPTATRSSRRYP
jgi:endonuclease/exonuclease/phosphatase family metal-dependent hydrolase